MKTTLFDVKGTKKADIELPKVFETPIREDLVLKCWESQKFLERQPYASYEEAGKRHSASGTISHRRHEWKGHYGKGISRIPRKVMYRSGVKFGWIGAEISGTRGGRRSHPPQGVFAFRKVNRKEMQYAINSALAATANKALILKRYSSLKEIPAVPAVVESLPTKAKELKALISSVYGDSPVLFRQKEVRSGKGKRRGRKYKSTSGLLLITSKDEKVKFTGVEIKNAKQLKVADLYPLGRLTLYTKKALEEMKNVA